LYALGARFFIFFCVLFISESALRAAFFVSPTVWLAWWQVVENMAYIEGGRDNSLGLATRLRVGHTRNYGSIPGKGKKF